MNLQAQPQTMIEVGDRTINVTARRASPEETKRLWTQLVAQAPFFYLQNQRLARIATVGADGQPHVVPVGFRDNPETDTIDIGGHYFAQRKKWRDVQHNPRVAVVIDDIASFNPWRTP